MPTQQEEIKEQILEWNSYLPEVKKQSIDVLVANIISLAVAQREKEIVEEIEKNKKDTNGYAQYGMGYDDAFIQIINLITKTNDKQNN